MSTLAIEAHGVSKTFFIPHEQRTTLREYIQHPLRRSTYERNDALNDVSVTIENGEFFGVIGANGSGKSTLLKILAGIYRPDAGNVAVNGLLSPFIELGVGFNFELNARDNIRLTGTLMGLSEAKLRDRFDEILAFAELERFVDQKLKNYSSGMLLRLAYSIAIQVPFDILLLDEVLAVGDSNFQAKCFETFERFREARKTIVFVSHDLASVERFCDRAMLIEAGEVKALGTPAEVIDVYRERENRRVLRASLGETIETDELASDLSGSPAPRRLGAQAGTEAAVTAVAIAEPSRSTVRQVLDEEFHAPHYIRHNQRRQEHLASLGLPIAGRSVLEVGAGIGDHTTFFLDRDCWVTATDVRATNVEVIRGRYPHIRAMQLDLDRPDLDVELEADIVYCYGTLYHLAHPAAAIEFMAECTKTLLLIETAVSPGDEESLNPVVEPVSRSTGISGLGCRPTRAWVYSQLGSHFRHVYLPITQPWHPEFPLDWTADLAHGIGRAVFIASREPLDNPLLSTEIPDRQVRH
jgi:ABC-type polysaccharide/polyol phosphate transport system ATPase subunit